MKSSQEETHMVDRGPDLPPIQLPLGIPDILSRVPHRFPFVLIDRVVGFEFDEWVECIKQVTINEPFFPGHFPEEPLFPGVLQIEAAAQASAMLVYLTRPDEDGLLVFGQVKRFTFIQPVRPGDCLKIRVSFKSRLDTQGLAEVALSVDGEPVAKGVLAYGKVPRPRGV